MPAAPAPAAATPAPAATVLVAVVEVLVGVVVSVVVVPDDASTPAGRTLSASDDTGTS
jgi:hypothetical protein